MPADLSTLDIAFGVVLILFILNGLRRGFILELTGLVGFIVGICIAGNPSIHANAVEFINSIVSIPRWVNLVAYIGIFFIVMLGIRIISALLNSLLQNIGGGFINRIFGAVAGLFKGAIFCTVLALCVYYLLPDYWESSHSVVAPYLGQFWSWVSSITGGAHHLPELADALNHMNS